MPSSGAGGKPTPNIAILSHQLKVLAQCNGQLCATTDEYVFVPLHLVGNPTTLDLKLGQKVPATVETFPANSTPVQVCLRPFNSAIRLNGQKAGNPIMVTIPAGGTSAPFSIEPVVASNLILIIESGGTQTGSIQGTINQ